MLRKSRILYAPDFVINAGGIIEIHHQRSGTAEQSRAHVERIGETLSEIFRLSDEQATSTVAVAEQLAEAKFQNVESSENSRNYDAEALSAAYTSANYD